MKLNQAAADSVERLNQGAGWKLNQAAKFCEPSRSRWPRSGNHKLNQRGRKTKAADPKAPGS